LKKRKTPQAFSFSRIFIENLEPRVLLSADLSGTINTSLLPAVLVPGSAITVPITITNNGDATASGSIAINLYTSADQTLDTNNDDLLKAIVGQGVNLAAGASQTVNAQFTLPNASPGAFFLLADIDANHVIPGDNFANNVAKSAGTVTIAYQFGTVGGKANVPLSLTDGDGTVVLFTLKGAGTGEVVPAISGASLVVTGTTAASSVSISAKGGDGFATLKDITVAGSLKSLLAPNIDIAGGVDFNADGANTGTVGSLRFHDVLNSGHITINGAGVPLTFAAHNVSGIFLGTLEPIKSITINQWPDEGAIVAASVAKLTAAGALNVDMLLSGAGVATGKNTLGGVKVGSLTGGAWSINGNSASISTGDVDSWNASITGKLAGLTARGNVVNSLLAASQIGKISISGNVADTGFVGGANFGNDAQPGGTEGAADTFAVGSILSVSVGGSFTNSIVAAGLDPVDDVIFNGNDVLINGGQLKAITVKGAVTDSYFLAQLLPASVSLDGVKVTPNPGVDPRFTIPVTSSGPNTPPILSAALTTDTGSSASDRVTNLVNIAGTVIDPDGITTLVAGFGDTPTFDIFDTLSAGAFALTPAQLVEINGGTMPDGSYTLRIQATDTLGTPSDVFTVSFTLDTAPATVPTLTIAPESDSGIKGDNHTSLSAATLTGVTSPNVTVSLLNPSVTTTSNDAGVFTFANVPLTVGDNSFIVITTDIAGNHSNNVPAVVITRESIIPGLNALATGTFTQIDETHYHYTLKLSNPGSTNIGTFWFAWIPTGDADFLTVAPTNIISPTGWTVEGGLSLEWRTTSAPLASGSGPLIFEFDSTETPQQLGSDAPGHPGTPALTSFVYIGAAFGDPGFEFVVTAG
jgi:hypothetical protein